MNYKYLKYLWVFYKSLKDLGPWILLVTFFCLLTVSINTFLPFQLLEIIEIKIFRELFKVFILLEVNLKIVSSQGGTTKLTFLRIFCNIMFCWAFNFQASNESFKHYSQSTNSGNTTQWFGYNLQLTSTNF